MLEFDFTEVYIIPEVQISINRKPTMKKFLLFAVFTAAVILNAGVGLSGNFNWQSDQVKTLHPGIQYAVLQYDTPRIMKAVIVKIDLKTPGLRFKVTPRAKEWGKPMKNEPRYVIRTRRTTVRKFMEQAVSGGDNMLIAINGAPWAPWKSPWNHPHADKMGLLISDGVTVSPLRSDRPSFIVDKNGSCSFAVLKDGADTSHIRQAISGFATVLQDGKLIVKDTPKNLAPRTGYGLSSDRRYLYFFVIDGRQPDYSMGCSVYEVGEFLRHFGASDALNMDGGGSTTIIFRNNGKITKMNHYRRGAERTVGASLGVIIDK